MYSYIFLIAGFFLVPSALTETISCAINSLCPYPECQGFLLTSPDVDANSELTLTNFDTLRMKFKVSSSKLQSINQISLVDNDGDELNQYLASDVALGRKRSVNLQLMVSLEQGIWFRFSSKISAFLAIQVKTLSPIICYFTLPLIIQKSIQSPEKGPQSTLEIIDKLTTATMTSSFASITESQNIELIMIEPLETISAESNSDIDAYNMIISTGIPEKFYKTTQKGIFGTTVPEPTISD